MQKKVQKILVALTLFITTTTWATTAADELKARLEKASNLSADYSQTLTDFSGKILQKGNGILKLKSPNLFRIENNKPQESVLVSDGKTLWFYDPFVEQATASWVKDVINNTPFVLLTNRDTKLWDQYKISQQADTFTLIPLSQESSVKNFNIRIQKNGILKNFSTTEKDGQSNLYILHNISNQVIPKKIFEFHLPEGAELDDQRQ